MMIWSFAFVGSASHWSAGPPAAAIWSYLSPGQMRPWCPGVTHWCTNSHWFSGSPHRARTPLGALQSNASRGRNLARELPREVPVALDAETNERSHGHTPVLDLGMAQEADRRLVACTTRLSDAFSFFVEKQQRSKALFKKVGQRAASSIAF